MIFFNYKDVFFIFPRMSRLVSKWERGGSEDCMGENGSSSQARSLGVGAGVTFMRTGAVLELRPGRQPPE